MLAAGPHYFIRHGQTDWNAEGRFQGQRDIPLNDIGRAQARANGVALRLALGDDLESFDFVASPLVRTRETMMLVREAAGLMPADQFSMEKAILELSFGEWEGQTEAELRVGYPQQMRERKADKWHYMPPGEDAESYETLSWRIAAWLERLQRPTVCVTHGGVIRALFKLSGTLEPQKAARENVPQDRILKFTREKAEWL
ncbi:histidine phosphatase family protein [Rhizobium sp. L1K21]|uniref:histidine phosphatase family protein n=1 Tax=Rhizobium sp. L1K21 TaxID=2954933 RepID=UPI00209298CC|nr:histidine phosphatase family protein [Rhizobium sp. L1K21]MCO6186854.1 histidine phosphatase family protein [Rhizobium sp. L1K21]